jgi:hypothetical protein
MTRWCYILGAGFSKACGLPLAGELTARIFKYRHDMDAKSGMEGFDPQETKQREQDFLRELFPAHNLNTNPPGFEDLMTVLDEWRDYNRACGGADDPYVDGFRMSLLNALHHLLCEQVDTARGGDRLNMVKRFLKRVHDEQSAIVSFNWDLLLEVAAQETGLEIAYQKKTLKNGICVAKPHGSLNLAELPEQKYQENKNAINVLPRDMKIEWEHAQTKTLVLRIQNPANDPKGVVFTFGPIVIPPTARKTYQSPWINNQWHFALDMVSKADEVVIIGYSLPGTDIRPRLLLQLARFRRSKLIPIRLVDPRAEYLRSHFEGVVGSPLEVISQPWESVAFDP